MCVESTVGATGVVAGLVILGYPLHPPGRPDEIIGFVTRGRGARIRLPFDAILDGFGFLFGGRVASGDETERDRLIR